MIDCRQLNFHNYIQKIRSTVSNKKLSTIFNNINET